MSFFRRLVERSKHKPAVEGHRSSQPGPDAQWSVPEIRTDIEGDAATVTVDLDEFGSETRRLLLDRLSQATTRTGGLLRYRRARLCVRSVGSPPRCPRCNANARQQMAHFIYATDIARRVMFAPAATSVMPARR